MANKDDVDKEYKRGEWGILCALMESWYKQDIPPILFGALRPFLTFVFRHKHTPIPWRHRLYILFTGELPQDF